MSWTLKCSLKCSSQYDFVLRIAGVMERPHVQHSPALSSVHVKVSDLLGKAHPHRFPRPGGTEKEYCRKSKSALQEEIGIKLHGIRKLIERSILESLVSGIQLGPDLWFVQTLLHRHWRFLGFDVSDAFSCLLEVHAAVPQQLSESAGLVVLGLVGFLFP